MDSMVRLGSVSGGRTLGCTVGLGSGGLTPSASSGVSSEPLTARAIALPMVTYSIVPVSVSEALEAIERQGNQKRQSDEGN